MYWDKKSVFIAFGMYNFVSDMTADRQAGGAVPTAARGWCM